MSFASPHPPVSIPDAGLYEFLFAGVNSDERDRIALVAAETDVPLSYRALLAAIDALASELVAAGVRTGDVVALMSPNSPGFVVAFHAILRAGATATTVNVLATDAEVAKQLTAATARTLVTVPDLLPTAKQAVRSAGLDDEAIVLLDDLDHKPVHRAAAQLLDESAPGERVAVLPFSSGTTGVPKAVVLTHRNLVANLAQTAPLLDLTPDDVVLAVLPFFHIYGMTVLMNASLAARSRIVTMARFDLAGFLDAIQRHRITYAFIAPPVALALAKHPLIDSYDLSSLRILVSGAAPLEEELGQAVTRRLGVPIVQGFGMTELSPVSHLVPIADGGISVAGSRAPIAASGWPVPNTVVKLIDPLTGEEIDLPIEGLSRPGELCVQGPNVMAGYLSNPQATADMIDSEGFLHTGDLARVDPTGCLYIIDRIKELIKYKGYQVAPAELEALLLTHPAISDAAVIGVPDADGEEVPKAFVVASDPSLTADEVIAFVAAQVAPYKKVRAVQFLTTIPKSAAGKILRKDLRNHSH
ncbi:AMP-binding protein [Nocardia farcinica]|uniref:AMP-binding protein n=1 Tax=Nocardia farcinica TaxID=37329 RepID=UPI0024582700|nr:AMP-binding protein [Nocardia farcinica]